MINDSFGSTFTNNSFTKSLKPRLFQFSGSNPEKSKFSKATFANFLQDDPSEGVDMKALRPKLSPKKLMEDPKFLISLQRRKKRIISGFEASNFLDEGKLILDKSKRNFSHLLTRRAKSNSIKKKEQFHKRQENNFFNNNFKKQHKTPYMNFNLHHLLKKKTNFDLKNSNSNGSSEAFYSTYLLGDNNNRPIHSSDSFRAVNRKISTRVSASALSHRRGKSLS